MRTFNSPFTSVDTACAQAKQAHLPKPLASRSGSFKVKEIVRGVQGSVEATGVSGILIGPVTTLYDDSGFLIGLKAFDARVVTSYLGGTVDGSP